MACRPTSGCQDFPSLHPPLPCFQNSSGVWNNDAFPISPSTRHPPSSPPPALYSNVTSLSVFLVAFPKNPNTPHSLSCLIFSPQHFPSFNITHQHSLFSIEYVNRPCLLIYLSLLECENHRKILHALFITIAPGSSAVPGT